MASTYTVNLGIEKIATGEQSGTWGTTTNTNFDIIDQAINGAVAVTLASAGTSGVPNTLAITDGATSDGRNKFIDFNDGGDLGATAYVQLTPNDAEKLVHIRNSLSGGRSLIIFQGTYNASNDFEIPNGKDVVLKFDGGGASATVTQVFEDLLVTAVAATTVDTTNIEVTNLKAKDGTAAGSIADSTGVVTIASSVLTTVDINGGSVDGVTLGTNSAVTEAQIDNININGNTISSTDTNGNVTITPDGTGSVAITKIDVAGGEIDATAIGANSASTGSFTTLNATGGGALTGTWTDLGSVTTVDINGGTIDGVTIGGSSAGAGSFTTLSATGDLTVDTNTLYVDSTNNQVAIGTTSPESRLTIVSGAGLDGQVFDAWYGSGNNQPLNIGINRSQGNSWLGWNALQSTTDTQTYHVNNTAVQLSGGSGALAILGAASGTAGNSITWITAASIGYTGSVFNEGGNDIDFRVESDSNTHALFVDAGDNNVGILTGTPSGTLQVASGVVNVGPNTAKPWVAYQIGVDFGGDGTPTYSYGSVNSRVDWVEINNNHYIDGSAVDKIANGTPGDPRYAQKMYMSSGAFVFQHSSNTATADDTTVTSWNNNLVINRSSIVVNDSGIDADFVVESDNNGNMLFVDASNDSVSIGTSSSEGKLTIRNDGNDTRALSVATFGSPYLNTLNVRTYPNNIASAGSTIFRLEHKFANDLYLNGYMDFYRGGSQFAGGITFGTSTDGSTNNRLDIGPGNIVVNQDGNDYDFRVESDAQTHALFVDAGNNRVAIGSSNATSNVAGNGLRIASNAVGSNYANSALSLYGTGGDFYGLNFIGNSGTGFGFLLASSATPDYLALGYYDGVSANSTVCSWNALGGITTQPAAGGHAVFNEVGNDADFRVEADNDTHSIFVDGANGRVGISDSAPKGDLSINGLGITVLARAYTMSTTPEEVLLLDNTGNTPVFIRVYRVDSSSPQGSELIHLYIACVGSGSNVSSVTLVQDDKVQNGSIHNVTFTAAVVSNNVHISVTGDDNGGESQTLNFEVHHIAGFASTL